jgi:hypothetical protein
MAITTIYAAPGKTVRLKNGGKIPDEGIPVELSDPYYQRRLAEGGIATTRPGNPKPAGSDPISEPAPLKTNLQSAVKRPTKGD